MMRPSDEADFTPCRDCACLALRRATRALTQHYERSFRGTGLRGTQFSLLALLAQTGPLPLTKMASMLGLERTTLTRNLRPLESRGLVRAQPIDSDQRVRQIELTPAGRAAAKKSLPAWRRAQSGAASLLRPFKLGELAKASTV